MWLEGFELGSMCEKVFCKGFGFPYRIVTLKVHTKSNHSSRRVSLTLWRCLSSFLPVGYNESKRQTTETFVLLVPSCPKYHVWLSYLDPDRNTERRRKGKKKVFRGVVLCPRPLGREPDFTPNWMSKTHIVWPRRPVTIRLSLVMWKVYL